MKEKDRGAFPLKGILNNLVFGATPALIMQLRIETKGYSYWQEMSVLVMLMLLTIIFSKSLYDTAFRYHLKIQKQWLVYASLILSIPMLIIFWNTVSIMFGVPRTFLTTIFYGMFLLLPSGYIITCATYSKLANTMEII